jgi:hypothetical protein
MLNQSEGCPLAAMYVCGQPVQRWAARPTRAAFESPRRPSAAGEPARRAACRAPASQTHRTSARQAPCSGTGAYGHWSMRGRDATSRTASTSKGSAPPAVGGWQTAPCPAPCLPAGEHCPSSATAVASTDAAGPASRARAPRAGHPAGPSLRAPAAAWSSGSAAAGAERIGSVPTLASQARPCAGAGLAQSTSAAAAAPAPGSAAAAPAAPRASAAAGRGAAAAPVASPRPPAPAGGRPAGGSAAAPRRRQASSSRSTAARCPAFSGSSSSATAQKVPGTCRRQQPVFNTEQPQHSPHCVVSACARTEAELWCAQRLVQAAAECASPSRCSREKSRLLGRVATRTQARADSPPASAARTPTGTGPCSGVHRPHGSPGRAGRHRVCQAGPQHREEAIGCRCMWHGRHVQQPPRHGALKVARLQRRPALPRPGAWQGHLLVSYVLCLSGRSASFALRLHTRPCINPCVRTRGVRKRTLKKSAAAARLRAVSSLRRAARNPRCSACGSGDAASSKPASNAANAGRSSAPPARAQKRGPNSAGTAASHSAASSAPTSSTCAGVGLGPTLSWCWRRPAPPVPGYG